MNLSDVRFAKVAAELRRGTGEHGPYPHPVSLEPPFALFQHAKLNEVDLALLGIREIPEPDPLKRLWRAFKGDASDDSPYLPEPFERKEPICFIRVLLPREYESTPALTEQLLLSIQTFDPVAFELIGTAQSIEVQLTASADSAAQIRDQLQVLHPELTLEIHAEADLLGDAVMAGSQDQTIYCRDYCLEETHGHPLNFADSFVVDPLSSAVAAMTGLHSDQWAVVQVLFQSAWRPWAENLLAAAKDEFNPESPALGDYPDLSACVSKSERPFFAVVIRLASSSIDAMVALEGFTNQFAGPFNRLARCDMPEDESDDLRAERVIRSLAERVTYRFGMLLNSRELAAIAHLPAPHVTCERLPRSAARTAPASESVQRRGIVLGQNVHRGRETPVLLEPEHRNRHVYLIGATRTGKSTLMLNMILQDMESAQGIAVIDPHGDLIADDLLPRVPKHRVKDVVYFNPQDRDHPFAFNVLAGAAQTDREHLCNDLLATLQRLFGDNWGPRMEHLLRYMLLTLLERPGSTLRDVRRLIDDDAFRVQAISAVTDSEVIDFWETEFGTYGENAFSPIRNKLGKFLAYPTVRNMLLQPDNRLDVRSVMDKGKILLCNLSQGTLGEEVSHVLGSLIVSRIQLAAMARANVPKHHRRDFHLYVDEFQNYISGSFEKILSEAGKYRLNLVLAHQFLKQLPERLQSAILDNVGTLICFRSGTDVARRLDRELGSFTTDDIVNLNRGEAIVRMGSAAEAFNLKTPPPPQRAIEDPSQEVILFSREKFTATREEVEAALKKQTKSRRLESVDDFYE